MRSIYQDIVTKDFKIGKVAFVASDVASKMVKEIISGNTSTTQIEDNIISNPIKGVLPAGDDNLFVQNLRSVVNSNYRTKKNIHLRQIELASQGIQAGIIEADSKGNEVFMFRKDSDWTIWNRRWNLNNHYLRLTAKNLVQYYFSPVEVVLNSDKSYISLVETKKAWTFRFAEPDNDGKITHCYLSAYWDENPKLDSDKVKKLPLLFNEYDLATTLKTRAESENETNFIVLLMAETDEINYPLPDYYPIITTGIVDISLNATKYKNYVIKNIVGASVIVYVADWYWEKKYSDWSTLLTEFSKGGDNAKKAREQLLEYRQEVVDMVSDLLSGAENAGRIILSDVDSRLAVKDPLAAKAITIEVIDKKNFTGEYLPDQQEADSQIDWSMMIDAARYGSRPGSTNNSGNAKNNSTNVAQISQFLDEELILEIPRLIRDFNGFNTDLEFQIRRTTLASLDAISPADRPIQKA